jgi:hypothetical protein
MRKRDIVYMDRTATLPSQPVRHPAYYFTASCPSAARPPSRLYCPIELGSRLPQKIQATAVTDPPSDASKLAPEPVFNKNVHKTIRNPSYGIRQPSTIDEASVDSSQTSEPHSADEERIVLYGVGMRGFVATQHVQLFLRNLTRLYGFVAVLVEIIARRFVVVDAVPLLQCPGGEDAVCPDEMEG